MASSPSIYLPNLNLKTFLMGICNVKACYHVACTMGSKNRPSYTMLHMLQSVASK